MDLAVLACVPTLHEWHFFSSKCIPHNQLILVKQLFFNCYRLSFFVSILSLSLFILLIHLSSWHDICINTASLHREDYVLVRVYAVLVEEGYKKCFS